MATKDGGDRDWDDSDGGGRRMLGIVVAKDMRMVPLIHTVTPRGYYGHPILKPRLWRLPAPVPWMDTQRQRRG